MNVEAFFDARSKRGMLVLVGCIAFIAAVMAMLLAQDTPVISRFSHDCFIYLNAGARVVQGQAPNVDFRSPLGPVMPLIMAAAVKLSSFTGYALPLSSGIVCLVSVGLTAIVGVRRVPTAVLGIYLLLPASMALGLYQLSASFEIMTYGSVFNRWGWALLLVPTLECLAPPAADQKGWLSRTQAAVCGFSLVAVFLTKANFIFPALVLVPLSFITHRERQARLVSMAAGATLGLLFFGAFIRFDYGALASGYTAAARQRLSLVHRDPENNFFIEMAKRLPGGIGLPKVAEVLRNEALSLMVAIVAAVVVPLDAIKLPSGGAVSRRRLLIAFAAVLLAPLVVVFTNWQWGELVTTPACVIVLLAWGYRGEHARVLALAGLSLLLSAEMVGRSAYTVACSLATRNWYAGKVPSFDAPPIHDLHVLLADSNCKQYEYVQRVNEGMRLLAAHKDLIQHGIWVADFSDPFSYALRLPYPRGDNLWWDARGTTFSETSYPDPAAFLSQVDIVMIPSCPEDYLSRDTAMKIYAPWLETHFRELEKTDTWVVLARATPVSP
jgi:hypothetical protein